MVAIMERQWVTALDGQPACVDQALFPIESRTTDEKIPFKLQQAKFQPLLISGLQLVIGLHN